MPVVFPPGDVNYIDRCNRSDGDVWDGAGEEIWDPFDIDGSASLLRISDNAIVATGEGGGLLLGDIADGIRIFRLKSTGPGYLMFFFRMVDGDGYALSMQGGTYTLYEVTDGVTFTPVDSHASSGSLGPNIRVGISFIDDEVSVYLGTLNYFFPTPFWSSSGLTNVGAGQMGFRMGSTSWAIDDWAEGDLISPSSGVTIYVDPDHPDADDDRNRTEASDPDTPLKSIDAFGWLVRAGVDWHDTIIIKRVETEDLGDEDDPHIYPLLDYRNLTNHGDDTPRWPFGNNEGNEPIVLKGDVDVDPETFDFMDPASFVGLPKIRNFHHRTLNNWEIHDLQFGYDLGEEFAFGTLNGIERCKDIVYRRCLFTGGFGIVDHWTDDFQVFDCWIEAKLGSTGIRPGAGLNLRQNANEVGIGWSVGQFLCERTMFKNVLGEDACVSYGLYGFDDVYDTMTNVIRDCVFWNVTEGNPIYHTDSIQFVSVPHGEVDRCVFIGCSDAMIVSDETNGVIKFTRNLTVGLNSALLLQGIENLTVAHNTFNHKDSPIKDASIYLYTRTPVDTVCTIVNNVMGGFYMADESGPSLEAKLGTYFSEGSIIENNLILSRPGMVTIYGSNLPGIPEFGHSDRLDVIDNNTMLWGVVTRNWELANRPLTLPGLSQGGIYDLGLDTDFFGRAYSNPPDVGCFQSDPEIAVVPEGRPPHIFDLTPTPNSGEIEQNVVTSVRAYPVPGNELDSETIDDDTFVILYPGGIRVPGTVVVLDPIDEDGYQKIHTTPPFPLRKMVGFRTRLSAGIADDQGNETTVATEWVWTTLNGSPFEPTGLRIGVLNGSIGMLPE